MLTFSIVTPSFNQARFLEATLRSVLEQEGARPELIVIDGGSTDGSVDLIRAAAERLAYWISEPDQGQADAINKGLRHATGDLVAFLNSDDLYLPGTLAAVREYFEQHLDCRWLCADTQYLHSDGRTEAIPTQVPRSAAHCLAWAYHAPQPGHFWRRDLLTEGFDPRWRYCFDHELYVRLLLAGHRCVHLPRLVASYRLHERSKTVAEGAGFDDEFDAIADRYESRLHGAARRWCRATRWIRKSCAASATGRRREALRWWLRALALHPEGIARRPFWGCLRRLLLPSPSPASS